MRSVETTGRTVEEAIENCLKELNVGRDAVEVEVMDEPNKGLFGILGSKQAKVRVTLKNGAEKIAEEFLTDILGKMQVEIRSLETERKEGYLHLYVEGSDMGILIGRRGETLDALQYLVNLVVNKRMARFGERIKIILDVEGYRVKREKTLIRLAERVSEKVKQSGNKIVLEPMKPQERRIIHTALQGDEEVETYSEGLEPFRKVIIAPRDNERETQ